MGIVAKITDVKCFKVISSSVFGPYDNISFFIRFTKQTLHRPCSYVYSVRIKLKAQRLNSIFAEPLFVMNLTINSI